MKQLLYVTTCVNTTSVGGREQLTKLNGVILQKLFGGGYKHIELNGVAGFGKLFGFINGVSRESIDLVCKHINQSGCRLIFLDGSNLGRLAEGIKKSIPDVEVVTFFHNCEARFFLGALRLSKSPRALAVLLGNYLAERSAARFSDKLICLNERDSSILKRLYGRGATHISAMAISDKLQSKMTPVSFQACRYALFVGGAFYANKAGIQWYCRNVAPSIPLETYVVGRGLEALKDDLERHVNVRVVGEIDDLGPWYQNAQVVVAPIFDGSGMKTKVAEALMFGKRIIGTPEAFMGYEDIAGIAGEVCVDTADFINALCREAARPFITIEPQLRTIYEDRYSFLAASSRLSSILESTC